MTSDSRDHRSLRLGTRGSPLALRQASIVAEALRAALPHLEVEVHGIRTRGDELTAADEEAPGEGLFVRAIERALLDSHIDAAVHSFKDMPTGSTPGLTVAAFPPRGDPRDVLVAREGRTLQDLPAGSTVGTGSPRRRALLLSLRPDLRVKPITGNVDTRLRRVAEGAFDAVVLAAAGLDRLGREDTITERFDPEVFTPAIGQGILAVQTRAEDEAARQLIRAIDHDETRACALAERGVAETIRAGCQAAVAAYAAISNGSIEVRGFMLAGDGLRAVRASRAGTPDEAEQVGVAVGADLLRQLGIGR